MGLNKIQVLNDSNFNIRRENDSTIKLYSRNNTEGLYYAFYVNNRNLQIPANTFLQVMAKDIDMINKNDLLPFAILDKNLIIAKNNLMNIYFPLMRTTTEHSRFDKKQKIATLNIQDFLDFIRLTSNIFKSNSLSMDSFILLVNQIRYVTSNSYINCRIDDRSNQIELNTSKTPALNISRLKYIEAFVNIFKEKTSVTISLYEYNDRMCLLNVSHYNEKNEEDAYLELLINYSHIQTQDLIERKIDAVERYLAMQVKYNFVIDLSVYSKNVNILNSFINDKFTIRMPLKMIFSNKDVIISQIDRSSRGINIKVGLTNAEDRELKISPSILDAIATMMTFKNKATDKVIKVDIREVFESTFLMSFDKTIHVAFES